MSTGYGTARWLREEGYRIVPADAIVIGRADVSKAVIRLNHPAPGDVEFDYGEQGHTERIPGGVSWDEWIALGLAIRDALAHPPVTPVSDEDVDYLTGLLMSDQSNDFRTVARRLLATGRVSVRHE